MIVRRPADPSPIRSAIVHTSISLAVFGAIAVGLGAGVHAMGHEEDASPRETLALFETRDVEPILKARLETPETEPRRQIASLTLPEPSLGVDYYPGGRAPAQSATNQNVEQGAAANNGVRINGHTVMPGQSLSEVVSTVSVDTRPEAGLWERSGAGRLPKVSEDGRTPMQAYSRPFSNPENRPAISVIVGGLGINRTHTQSVIDELPPEVTLSFVPYARGLQRWVDKAREAGHEVLIEMPMEPYDYGRIRPHPHTLSAGLSADDNVQRLEWLLSQATGYFGVINSEGGKFASNQAAADPVFAALANRGVAFIEDGTLQRSKLKAAAAASGAPFAQAIHKIDETAQADAIEARLLALETEALEKRSALATGFAFPVTIDVLKAWTDRLYGKGFILAPASAVIETPAKPAQVKSTKVTGLTAPPTTTGDPAP